MTPEKFRMTPGAGFIFEVLARVAKSNKVPMGND